MTPSSTGSRRPASEPPPATSEVASAVGSRRPTRDPTPARVRVPTSYGTAGSACVSVHFAEGATHGIQTVTQTGGAGKDAVAYGRGVDEVRPVEPSGDWGWFAYPKSPATTFRQNGERRPLPREREPHVGPIGIRMFVDDVSGIGLWPGKGWHDLDPDPDEETLPIADDLRGRIRDWVDEYTESIGAKPHWTLEQLVDHDIRGDQLATELQDDLGADYVVEFSCNTAEGRRVLRGGEPR